MRRRVTLPRGLARLIRDRRGIATLEFGFAAPVVILMILGAFEIGYFMFAQTVLEGAAREAARQGITGYVPCNMTREEYIQAVIDRSMLNFSEEERRSIDRRVYKAFGDIGEPEEFSDENGNGIYDNSEPFSDVNGNNRWDPDMAQAGLGGPGDVVVYDITYQLSSMTGFFAHVLGIEDGLNITASTAVRNEPASVNPMDNGECTV